MQSFLTRVPFGPPFLKIKNDSSCTLVTCTQGTKNDFVFHPIHQTILIGVTDSIKRKYTLLSKLSTQNQAGREEKSGVCAASTIELVQAGTSLIMDQPNGVCCAPHTFHLAPLHFEYSARQKAILSLWGDCVYAYHV